MRKCCIKGCKNEMYNKKHGWCRAHYSRWMRHGDPLAGYRSPGIKIQFLRDALKSNTGKCIIFPFASPTQRYGFVKFRNKQRLAHRVVCFNTYGPPPTPKHEAAHKCGNGLCINPRHIRWKTHSYNNLEDKIRHGTIMRGEDHHKHKLNESDVYAIRKLSKTGMKGVDLAEIFNVTPTQITRIVKRVSWFWLSEN